MITESHDAAPYDPSMSQRPSDVYCSINICHAALTAQPYPSWPMSTNKSISEDIVQTHNLMVSETRREWDPRYPPALL
jgi:hypothetical protein